MNLEEKGIGMAGVTAGNEGGGTRSRGSSTSHGMFSRLHLTVECPTEFGQTVHVSGSSFLAGVSNPSLVSHARTYYTICFIGGLETEGPDAAQTAVPVEQVPTLRLFAPPRSTESCTVA